MLKLLCCRAAVQYIEQGGRVQRLGSLFEFHPTVGEILFRFINVQSLWTVTTLGLFFERTRSIGEGDRLGLGSVEEKDDDYEDYDNSPLERYQRNRPYRVHEAFTSPRLASNYGVRDGVFNAPFFVECWGPTLK